MADLRLADATLHAEVGGDVVLNTDADFRAYREYCAQSCGR